MKLLADYIAHGISLAFCVIMLVATAQQALRALSDDTTLSALPILAGPAYSFVPLGFFALTVLMLIDLRRIRTGQAMMFTTEAPTA
jgi:TRAP-type C4-dicarboxylate transport system permease small subunit